MRWGILKVRPPRKWPVKRVNQRINKPAQRAAGFTLIELVMVILLFGIISATVYVKLPVSMQEQAATYEFKRAVRTAQHYAMTRLFWNDSCAWGISTSGATYSITRRTVCTISDNDSEYLNIVLTGNTAVSSGALWFNALGEPMNDSLVKTTTDVTFTIGTSSTVTISPETGYVESN